MTWLLDFVGYSMRNAPAIRTSLAVLHTLQNHYPERLGQAVCYYAPTLFSMTWKAVCPFIDAVTKNKITFVEKGPQEEPEMSARFHMEHIEACMGGRHQGLLFQLDDYRQRMQVEDAAVANSIRMLEVHAGSPSMASDLSDASSATQYARSPSPLAMAAERAGGARLRRRARSCRPGSPSRAGGRVWCLLAASMAVCVVWQQQAWWARPCHVLGAAHRLLHSAVVPACASCRSLLRLCQVLMWQLSPCAALQGAM
ncbi:CRAL-TRIO domain-containing protein [Scenedesmus sp. NREL 46B-D3]|nr:CRAL-TRIO domain-containing protein [Scenedesmus sp. NREL 46B-D3]